MPEIRARGVAEIAHYLLFLKLFCGAANWHGICTASPGHEKRGLALPFKLDEVREALGAIGVAGMTVSEVKGFGRQKGQTEIYRGAEYSTNMVPKIKIEVACASDIAERVVEAIQQSANTGAIGDGKIFVFELGQAVRIRTGETDSVAL